MGPLIALEGGEGVGKSTQIRLLRERFPQTFPSREFIWTREPGGSDYAEMIRDVILSREGKDADARTMFALFTAARYDHARTVIRPYMEQDVVVLCDRFVGSSFAYQTHAMENPVSEQRFAQHIEDLGFFPNLTIVLDMDPADSLERLKRRDGDVSNHFDERGIDFHQRLRSGYQRFAELYRGYNVITIDAARDKETVYEEIVSLIRAKLQ